MVSLYIVNFEGDVAELVGAYERVNGALAEEAPGTAAVGLIHHTCVTTPGGIRLFDLWESEEAADRFYGGDLLRTQFTRAGLRPLSAGQITVFPVHEHSPRQ